jgi:subtilisin family serine protease
MSEEDALRLSEDTDVKYVEEDSIMEIQTTQLGATWGISRIDQRAFIAPQDSNYNYNATGAGVNVYVLDTGVLTTHPDFGGRAVDAFDVYRDGGDMTRCNGHGTHVAGTIGSNTYGVAKDVTIYSVKVYPCDTSRTGTMSDILSGINWVTRNAIRPAVANMSMSGAASQALDDAVSSSSAAGIIYVVSAGNFNDNACNHSPGRTPEAITVASTDERDYRSSISSFGRCVDLFAPGEFITSLSNHPDSPIFIMSGTSTSSPHVAGIAALYLERHPTATPADVQSAIVNGATPGAVTDPGSNTPNLFAYSVLDPETPSCAGTTFSGYISRAGASSYQSSQSGFAGLIGLYSGNVQSGGAGVFSLSLEVKQKNRWVPVATSDGGSTLMYDGRRGTYRWRISSVSGKGSYTLCASVP